MLERYGYLEKTGCLRLQHTATSSGNMGFCLEINTGVVLFAVGDCVV